MMQIISRESARAAGLKRFFTGKPCRRGHVAQRYVSYGGCCACERTKLAAWKNTPGGRQSLRKYNRTPKALAKCRAYRKRRKIRDPWCDMLHAAKQRAKRLRLPFNIDVAKLRIPDRCPVLGITLVPGNRKKHDWSPSLDRLVPELGYVNSNVRVISYRANMLKNNATAGELRAVAAWMEKELTT